MSIWVFIAGALMTAFAGRHYGFLASGALTVASVILVYRFIDRDVDGDIDEE